MQPLDNNDNLKTSHLMKWAQQIAEAMTILHEKNVRNNSYHLALQKIQPLTTFTPENHYDFKVLNMLYLQDRFYIEIWH